MDKFNARFPRYNDDTDFTTNAPSYYDYLARLNKLMKYLAEKIGHYDKELAKKFDEINDRFKDWDKNLEEFPDEVKNLLIEWLDDGKLSQILADLMLEDYATIQLVEELIYGKIYNNNYTIEKKYDSGSDTSYFVTKIVTDNETPIIFDSGGLENIKPTEYAKKNQTTLTINGGLYPDGINIINRNVISDNKSSRLWAVGITENNDLISIPPNTTAEDLLNTYPEIVSTLTGFTPLIENANAVDETILEMGRHFNYNDKHPRQIIGHDVNGNIMFLTTGGRGADGLGMTADECIRVLQYEMFTYAFMLDGGGSTSLVEKGKRLNSEIDGLGTKERSIRTVISLSNSGYDNPQIESIRDLYSKVGEMNKLINDMNLTYTSNLNNITEAGDYWALSNAEGVPADDNSWFVIHKKLLKDHFQIAFPYSTSYGQIVLIRRTIRGEWSEWFGGNRFNRNNSIKDTTKPDDLPFGEWNTIATNWSGISQDTSTKNGLVKSMRFQEDHHGYTKQIFYHGGSVATFLRTANSNNTWSKWYRMDSTRQDT